MEKSERLNSIDLLKVIAIFFVVSYHINIYQFDFLKSNTWGNYLTYTIRALWATCVPLFFFANGYLLLRKPLIIEKHVKKTVKLIFLTFIWRAITMAALMFMNSYKMGYIEFCDVYFNKTEWAQHLWFMETLVMIYLLFPLLKIAYDQSRMAFVFFIMVCVFLTLGENLMQICGAALSYYGVNVGIWKLQFASLFSGLKNLHGYSLVYFMFGGLVGEHMFRGGQTRLNMFSLLGSVVCTILLSIEGIFYSRIINGVWDVVWNGYGSLFTFCNVIFIFCLCQNYKINSRVIEYVSKNSLGIYFLHLIFINIFYKYMSFLPIKYNIGVSMGIAIIIVAICTLLIFILKKIPLISKLL